MSPFPCPRFQQRSHEKPPVCRTRKNSPTLHEPRRFAIVFAIVRQLSILWFRYIQYISYNSISQRLLLIFFPRLFLFLPNCCFPSGFPIKILFYSPPLPFPLHTLPVSPPPWFNHSNYIWRRVTFMKLVLYGVFRFLPCHPSSEHPPSDTLSLMSKTELHSHFCQKQSSLRSIFSELRCNKGRVVR
jgi:hypothetical protein